MMMNLFSCVFLYINNFILNYGINAKEDNSWWRHATSLESIKSIIWVGK